MRYNVCCPHCGDEHPLEWGGKDKPYGFKWTKGQPDTVRHFCPHCGGGIQQGDYLRNWVGTWICTKTRIRYGADQVWRDASGQPIRPPRHVAFQVWTAYSPQRAWSDIVREFEQAHASLLAGDVGPMQGFVNETRGETWEVSGERTDEHALQQRAEPYSLRAVPVGGLLLTASVDVQRTWWDISVWAWSRGLESWVVDHHLIEGNPASEDDWKQVTTYLQRRYPQAWHGGSMGLSAISIDSSDQTHAVYNWVRTAQYVLPQLRAIKGSSEDHKPIVMPATLQDINWRGQKWPNGIKLWQIGTDTAKDLLLGQLAIQQPGPGYVHFSHELPREWYEQLTAEQRILTKVNGRDTYKWVKRRPRNEILDCRNMALHAVLGLGVESWSDRKWSQLEASVQPPPDLFTQALPPASTQQAQSNRHAHNYQDDDHDDYEPEATLGAEPAFTRDW